MDEQAEEPQSAAEKLNHLAGIDYPGRQDLRPLKSVRNWRFQMQNLRAGKRCSSRKNPTHAQTLRHRQTRHETFGETVPGGAAPWWNAVFASADIPREVAVVAQVDYAF